MAAEPYGIGVDCTWHGPLTFAKDITLRSDTGPQHACPSCGGSLKVTTVEQFWLDVAAAEKQRPGYEQLMCWSEGKCYPDFDTMENAWRQSLEGTL